MWMLQLQGVFLVCLFFNQQDSPCSQGTKGRESKECACSYVPDSNDLCPSEYLLNAVRSLENISRTEQVAVFPAAV